MPHAGNATAMDEQPGQPAPAELPAPVSEPVAAACRARLLALAPVAIAAACSAVDAAVRGLPVTGCESAAAATAALEGVVANCAAPGAPREVARLLRARAAVEYGTLQMAAAGERLGQAGQAAAGRQLLQRYASWARAEGGIRPSWGAAEMRLVIAAARRAELAQVVQAAERALADAQQSCAAAHAAQGAIVRRLPALDPAAGGAEVT